jgi:hypothetical protein
MRQNETKSQELARFKLMAVFPNTIAALLNISERSVSQLRDQHEIETNAEGKYPLVETVAKAFEHSRKSRGRGRPATTDDPENPLVAEQIRKVKAQADAYELKNEVTRRNLIPRDDVVEGMRSAFQHARARILALPKKAAPAIVGETSIVAIEKALEDHVAEVCADLAETVVLALLADASDDGGSGDSSDADMDSAAETDG